jgi:hypothetical protein
LKRMHWEWYTPRAKLLPWLLSGLWEGGKGERRGEKEMEREREGWREREKREREGEGEGEGEGDI